MGRAKALLEFDGEPLIVHLVRRLAARFAERIVVAGDGQTLPALEARIVRDELPGLGPLGGLYTGLRAATADVAFVTACDAPFLNAELAAALVERLGTARALVPHCDGRLQPLHAVYRREAATELRARLDRGELRTIEAARALEPAIIGASELRELDPEGLSFRNLNRPEDYAAALETWAARRS